MEQFGEVVSVDGDAAKVRVRRQDVCSKCGGCGVAVSGPGDNFIDARNVVNAVVGQTVKVTSDTGQVLKASFVVYIVPIVALLIGILLGQQIGRVLGLFAREELVGLFVGIIFLLLSYMVVRGYDRSMTIERMKATVVEIVEEPIDMPKDEKC
jgi:sigma-E factor negative regulatory protein RseC